MQNTKNESTKEKIIGWGAPLLTLTAVGMIVAGLVLKLENSFSFQLITSILLLGAAIGFGYQHRASMTVGKRIAHLGLIGACVISLLRAVYLATS